VNPDFLKNQIEGSIVQSLSKVLFEEVKFDRPCVTSVDWTGYPVIRFPDVPQIDVALIDRPDQPLMGAGEASLPPVGGALANAHQMKATLRALTGAAGWIRWPRI
jgi:CO/xanthine dehydrogenase Mo-binding subunit